jgi:hypothetical protein
MKIADLLSQTSLLIALAAAIGAIVASILNVIAILVNGWLERRIRKQEAALERDMRRDESARERSANRKQWLMQEAAKLADWRLEITKKNSDNTGVQAMLTDPVKLMEGYYGLLTHLWKHGRLPSDMKAWRREKKLAFPDQFFDEEDQSSGKNLEPPGK